MSIPNFNLFNKFCFDKADETLLHVSNYCSLNNTSSNLSYINNNVSFSSSFGFFLLRVAIVRQ